jgi:hypothetical protein
MLRPALYRYVQYQTERQVLPEQLKAQLLLKGWSKSEVEEAIRLAGPEPQLLEPPADVYELGLRLGLFAVFLVNSLVAWVDPGGFVKLIESSFLAPLGHTDWMLAFIRANDLVVGILVLAGLWKRQVYLWIGLYFLSIAVIKITAL